MKAAFALLFAILTVMPARSEQIRVTVTGEVEFNQVTDPPLGDVTAGADAEMTFLLDTENFVDSLNFPTRGYVIDEASFLLTLGPTELGLQDPFPAGQMPFFSLRDNDPAVDGFFVATSVDFPTGVPIDQAGAFDQFRNLFSVTYEGDVLSSLDLADAVGSYDFTQLTVFNWTLDDGPFSPVGIVFTQMTLAADPIFTDGFESGDVLSWSSTAP